MTQGSHKFMTNNSQRSLHHVVSIDHNDLTFLRTLAAKSNYDNGDDNKEISFEREAPITEIHAQSASL